MRRMGCWDEGVWWNTIHTSCFSRTLYSNVGVARRRQPVRIKYGHVRSVQLAASDCEPLPGGPGTRSQLMEQNI